nr:HAMP domain-containing sensor histidine kinase [Leucobacter luti]
MAAGVERALAQQRSFVADASHQLRNPLAAIRLRLDALSLGTHTDDDLHRIDEDTERLEHIVDRMLTLAGVEHRVISAATGTETAVPKVRVIPSAEGLVMPHVPLHTACGQTLTASGGPVTVECALSDLEEMVELGLDNARKYAGEGAHVRVALQAAGEWVDLTISDDGPGLNDADLAHAQSRFWRGNGSDRTAAPQSGTGLGLAILTGLARANGGTLALAHAAAGGLELRIRLRSGAETA